MAAARPGSRRVGCRDGAWLTFYAASPKRPRQSISSTGHSHLGRGNPDHLPPPPPGSRHAVEDARAGGAAVPAAALGIEIPSSQVVPVAADQHLVAMMAVGGLAFRIV